jgi:Flp pilus assembly protein TadG
MCRERLERASVMSLVRILVDCVRTFVKSRRGNVAWIYALGMIPLALAAGGGLDYARAIVVRNSLSEALDAAALAVGSSPGLTTSEMQTLAQHYFDANYRENADYGTPSPVTVTPNGQSLVVATSVSMPTTMLKMVGIQEMAVSTSSKVVWGQLKVWVSLVLDNSTSMDQGDASGTKIAQLTSATHNLLNLLQGASSNPGDVKVAIVPFVADVNVGTASVNASWLDWTDWDAANGTCSISGKSPKSTCEGTTGTWSGGNCTISGVYSPTTCITKHGTWSNSKCNISTPTYNKQSDCQAALATWIGGSCNLTQYSTIPTCTAGTAVWTPANHSTWKGCVMDRGSDSGPDATYNYDAMNSSPVPGRQTSYFPPEQTQYCPKALMGLSYDWSALSSEVDALSPNGYTNQTIGLVWGWHALSQGDPMNAPALPAGTARYIIILSDGLNTRNRWNTTGSTTTANTAVDARMSMVCTNAKAAGVVIYAVYVDIGGTQGNSSVLQNCASDSSKYFDLTSGGQINAAFAAIGQQITNLRVSQ